MKTKTYNLTEEIIQKIIAIAIIFTIVGIAFFSGIKTTDAAISAVTGRGSNVSGSGNQSSLAVTPTGNITVGKMAFFAIVTDNSDTTDNCTSTSHSVTDTAGNTWTRILECTETDGAADDGTKISLFATKVTTQISTTDTVTVQFGSGRSDTIAMLYEVTVGAGNTLEVAQIGTGQNSLTAAVSGLASREYLFLYHGGAEGEDNAKTPTTNYTELFDLLTTTSGALDANLSSYVQTRIATLTSSSALPTAWTFTNAMTSLTALFEDVLPTLSISQPDGVSDSVIVGASYNITYTLADSDDVMTAAFYYDTNNDMTGGVAISGPCATAAEGTGVTCAWDTTGMTPGSYYIYGQVSGNGGIGSSAVKAVSAGQITISAAGITISGTANGNNGATVKVAVGASVAPQTTTISGGTWTISDVGAPATGAIITVWVDNVSDTNESTAVTKYDGSGNITGMFLDTNVLSIGSDDNQSISFSDINTYGCDADEDVMHDYQSGELYLDGTDTCAGAVANLYTDETFRIESGDTVTAGTTDALITDNIIIAGTITSVGNTLYYIGGDWTNNGTFTQSTSNVMMTGTTAQTITGSTQTTFNSLTISNTTNPISISTSISVGGTMTVNANATTTPSASVVISGAGTLTGSGTVQVTRTSATADFASQYTITNKTLTNLTVEYTGAGQVLTNTTYGPLKISGSISTGTNNATVAGLFTVTGTFTPSAGTMTFNNGSSITNSGTLTFFNITTAASATLTANTSFSVAGTLTNGSSAVLTPSSGTITMSATGSGISNSGTLTFNNLTIAETPTAQTQYNTSFSVGGTLTVSASKTFSPTSGTITVNGGGSIVNSGTLLSFQNLTTSCSTTSVTANTSFTVKGTLTNGSTCTLAPTSGTYTFSGTGSVFTNNGTYTASGTHTDTFTNAGTVTIDGSTVTTTFFNLTAGTTGTALKFKAGNTYVINGLLTLTSVTVDTDTGAGTWTINHQGTEAITGTTITRSACHASSTDIDALTSSSNVDGGSNGTCWIFTAAGPGVTISGIIYSDGGSTALDCSVGGNRTVRVKVNGAGTYSADCTLNTGAFSVGSVAIGSAGDVITVFLDDETENANLVTLAADNSSDITGVNLYQNHLIVRSESATAVTNTNLNQYDANTGSCAAGTGEDDLIFCVTSGNLTLLDGAKLLVWTGDSFTPGGTVTTDPSASSSSVDGDVEIQASATLTMGTNALSIGGDFINAGTFAESGSPHTTTFTATASDHTINNGTGNLDKVVFNGSGGGWSFSDASNTINDDITVTAGTLSGTNSITVNGGDVTGNGTISLTNGTFTLDGTGNFGGDTGWSFVDLVFGDGSGAETTTGTGTGSITASTTSISVNQTFDAGSKTLIITGESYSSTETDTVTFVDVGNGTAGLTNTVSLTNLDISGTNRVVYVAVSIRGLDNSPTVTSVTVGGVAAEAVASTAVDGVIQTHVWRLINPSVGTGVTVTANLSANSTNNIYLGAISLSGVDQTTPDEAENTQAGTLNGTITTSVTTLTANAMVVDFVHHRNDGDITEGVNQTNRLEHTDGSTIQAISTKPVVSPGSTDMTWSNGVLHSWGHVVLSIKPASTVTPVNPFVISGQFDSSSGIVQYSGNNVNVATTTYNGLTLGGTGIYSMPYNGTTLTGNLVITDGAEVIESVNGIIAFSGGTTQTFTDNNSSTKQDVGDIRVTSSGNNTAWCSISSTSCNSSWLARKRIVLNNASSSALTNFPILVTLNSGSIDYSKTQSSGQDIRFVDADGTTILSHEIETWNESATSTVWVKVPQIDANSVTDYIWMYYDNASVADGQDTANVWDSDFVSIWHLGESSGCPTTINDSVGVNDMSCTGTPSAVTGQINGGRDFNGSDQYFEDASGSGLGLLASGTYTWSTWINSDSLTANSGWATLFNQANDGANTEGFVLHAHTISHATLPGGSITSGISAYWDNDSASIVTEAENVVTVGSWYHVTVTYDGSKAQAERFRIYVNGKDVTGSTSSSGTLVDASTNNARIAGNIRWDADKFDGKADEVRFSDGLRSADWIRAEYRTTNNEMIAFSPEETQSYVTPDWCDIGTSCTSSWLTRRPIYINNASSTLANFPILVSLNSSNIDYTKTQGAGQDIRFVDADGTTLLPHEIETWNESATSTVWVKVPSITNTNSDYIWMYYDNSGAADAQDPTNVWDTNYKAVFHFPDGSSLSANDATSNNVDGTINNATASAGRVGAGSASLNGTTAYINLSQPAALTGITGSMTISGWINTDTLAARTIISQQGAGGARGYDFAINASGIPYFELASNSTTLFTRLSSVTVTAGKWYYVTGVYDASAQTLNMYIDGVLSNSTLTGTVAASQYIPANDVNIGRRPVADEYWDGLLDEIRISNAARSADWIKAESRNVRDEMLAFGLVETYTAATPTTLNLSSSVKVSDVTVDPLNTLSLNGSNTLTFSGNDFVNNGTFTGSTGTFTVSPSIPETAVQIRGSSATTFYNFTADKPLSTLSFKASQTVTVGGTLNITGAEGRPITIQSDTPSTQWTLYLTGSGSINYIVVKDSACHASSNSVIVDSINNQGNNGSCIVAITRAAVAASNPSGGGNLVTGGGQAGDNPAEGGSGGGEEQTGGGQGGGGGANGGGSP